MADVILTVVSTEEKKRAGKSSFWQVTFGEKFTNAEYSGLKSTVWSKKALEVVEKLKESKKAVAFQFEVNPVDKTWAPNIQKIIDPDSGEVLFDRAADQAASSKGGGGRKGGGGGGGGDWETKPERIAKNASLESQGAMGKAMALLGLVLPFEEGMTKDAALEWVCEAADKISDTIRRNATKCTPLFAGDVAAAAGSGSSSPSGRTTLEQPGPSTGPPEEEANQQGPPSDDPDLPDRAALLNEVLALCDGLIGFRARYSEIIGKESLRMADVTLDDLIKMKTEIEKAA